MTDPRLKSLRSPDDILRTDKIEQRSVEIVVDCDCHELNGITGSRQLYAASVVG